MQVDSMTNGWIVMNSFFRAFVSVVWPRAGIYHKIRTSKGVIVKRTILVALLLLSFTTARSQDGSAFSAKLDEYLTQAARQGFSGATLISRDGKIIFAKGYGLANREL